MTTFSIVEDGSVGSSGVSAGVIAQVKSGILAAAELWNRYFAQGSADLKIELIFSDISGSALATGGTSFFWTGVDGPGQEIWTLNSLDEYIAGVDTAPGGDDIDLTITIDTPTLLSGDFYFDPSPFDRTDPIPSGMSDFISVMIHEIGHGLGFLGSVDGEPGSIDDDGPDITPFDDNVDLISGERFFTGAMAVSVFGGPIKLDPGSLSHIADSSDGGFENVMDPSLLDGSRDYIMPVHVAMFADMGMPLRVATSGADRLYGYDFTDDAAGSLLGGNDTYDGLSGDDSVDGGAGDDTLFGGLGSDTLIGSGDDDNLRGEAGDDFLFGGFGKDRALGGIGDDFIRTGPDNDTLLGDVGNDTLGASNRTDLLRGEAGDDLLLGSNGNDRLFGDAGSDTLLGGNGRDTIEGGVGADRLVGGAGNDRMRGLAGPDTLIGNSGDDRFQFFSTDASSDTVTDFEAGAGTDDKIVLVGFGAAFDTFAEVMAAAAQVGPDTVITLSGGNTITLEGVSKSALHPDDFIL